MCNLFHCAIHLQYPWERIKQVVVKVMEIRHQQQSMVKCHLKKVRRSRDWLTISSQYGVPKNCLSLYLIRADHDVIAKYLQMFCWSEVCMRMCQCHVEGEKADLQWELRSPKKYGQSLGRHGVAGVTIIAATTARVMSKSISSGPV